MDPDRLPRIISDELFQAAGRVAIDNTKWSPRRVEPGQWLLKGLVKCGVCSVGTRCHKMRGRNGTSELTELLGKLGAVRDWGIVTNEEVTASVGVAWAGMKETLAAMLWHWRAEPGKSLLRRG